MLELRKCIKSLNSSRFKVMYLIQDSHFSHCRVKTSSMDRCFYMTSQNLLKKGKTFLIPVIFNSSEVIIFPFCQTNISKEQ